MTGFSVFKAGYSTKHTTSHRLTKHKQNLQKTYMIFRGRLVPPVVFTQQRVKVKLCMGKSTTKGNASLS